MTQPMSRGELRQMRVDVTRRLREAEELLQARTEAEARVAGLQRGTVQPENAVEQAVAYEAASRRARRLARQTRRLARCQPTEVHNDTQPRVQAIELDGL